MRGGSMEDRAGDLMGIAQGIKDDVMASMHSSMPGIIHSFNAEYQTAEVQVAIRRRVKHADGVREERDPLLLDVPVCFLGGGGHSLTFPVQKGDECIVFFADRCIDAWYQSGGVQNQVMPRMHDLSDGFALVGVRSKPNTINDFNEVKPNFAGGLMVDGDSVSGFSVGSVYLSAISALPSHEGTWVALTPQTLFGKTIYAWERTI